MTAPVRRFGADSTEMSKLKHHPRAALKTRSSKKPPAVSTQFGGEQYVLLSTQTPQDYLKQPHEMNKGAASKVAAQRQPLLKDPLLEDPEMTGIPARREMRTPGPSGESPQGEGGNIE